MHCSAKSTSYSSPSAVLLDRTTIKVGGMEKKKEERKKYKIEERKIEVK